MSVTDWLRRVAVTMISSRSPAVAGSACSAPAAASIADTEAASGRGIRGAETWVRWREAVIRGPLLVVDVDSDGGRESRRQIRSLPHAFEYDVNETIQR